MSNVPPPNPRPSPGINPNLRIAIAFVAKAVVFTTIFWTVWLFCLQPLFYGESAPANRSARASDDELRARYEQQLTAGEDMIKRQDELLGRWQKVIERWEQAAPKGK